MGERNGLSPLRICRNAFITITVLFEFMITFGAQSQQQLLITSYILHLSQLPDLIRESKNLPPCACISLIHRVTLSCPNSYPHEFAVLQKTS